MILHLIPRRRCPLDGCKKLVKVRVNISERCPGVFFEYVSGVVRVAYQRRVMVRACCYVSQPVPKVLADHVLSYSKEHIPEPAVVIQR